MAGEHQPIHRRRVHPERARHEVRDFGLTDDIGLAATGEPHLGSGRAALDSVGDVVGFDVEFDFERVLRLTPGHHVVDRFTTRLGTVQRIGDRFKQRRFTGFVRPPDCSESGAERQLSIDQLAKVLRFESLEHDYSLVIQDTRRGRSGWWFGPFVGRGRVRTDAV